MDEADIRKVVRKRYAEAARQSCSCRSPSCCGDNDSVSRTLGYSEAELASLPEGADLGLGCGNPTALASLAEGEVVLDLGSGAGIDCFLAAQAVGGTGRVIGVDMTTDMIDRARANAARNGIGNVEFRLGEIEHLPVADGEVDVVISNCVINLSPDKPQVFREAFRALKPGGRLIVSDIVALAELPDAIRSSLDAYAGCIAGALRKEEYLAAIADAGFREVEVEKEVVFDAALSGDGDPTLVVDGKTTTPEDVGLTSEEARRLAASMASIGVRATKP
ncbi:MAG: arsenite methyltransferase [Candidatus Bipolaricaulota bacterium]|nr:MAG: arsenite methyltransferase [Candidatus Bipolaricaulota bacterium]